MARVQAAEVSARTDAVVASIRATFREARADHNRAVVLLTQADMFDPHSPAVLSWTRVPFAA